MSNLSPEDLSREIERLWTRLGSVAVDAPAAPQPSSAGAELAWETVSMLKVSQRRREAALAEAISAKDESLKHWRGRAESLEAEAADRRARAEGGDAQASGQLLDAQQRLDGAAHALEHERTVHQEERRRLETALEESRERITAERRQQEAARADSAVSALKGTLSETKNALEKTLSELLLERHERLRVEDERARALKKTDEVEQHFTDLQKLWEEERAQWRELCDRKRSTWEAQRQELAQWEETLRREREAWHAELQEKEKSHPTFTDSLTGKIRDTTGTAEQVADRIRQIESREERDRAVRARAAALVLVGAALIAVSIPAWRWGAEWRYEAEATTPIAALNPTALAFDGALLWVADWGGRLSALDPADPRRAVREVVAPASGPFRPTALAFGEGRMWTLDAARARLIRAKSAHPEAALSSLASPGPAPTALAFDGLTLWSYDAANRALYRHGGDEASFKAYTLKEDVVPNALAWVNGKLWLHDTKSRRILVYAFEDDRFTLKESHLSPDAATVGFAVLPAESGLRVWALVGPSAHRAQPALLRLRLHRRLPFAKF